MSVMTTTLPNTRNVTTQSQSIVDFPFKNFVYQKKGLFDNMLKKSSSLNHITSSDQIETTSFVISHSNKNKYSSREELLSIFGDMVSFPDEDERIYNANFEAKCIKTGINIFDL